MTDESWGKKDGETVEPTQGSSSSESQRLLRALRVAVPVEDPDRVAARRNFLVNVIEREIRNTPARITRQDRRLKWSRVGLAAAAVLLATWAGGVALQDRAGSEIATSPDVTTGIDGVAEGKAKITLHDGSGDQSQVLSVGQELALRNEQSIRAELPGHTQLQLQPIASEKEAQVKLLHLSKADQTLFVTAGKLFVDVPEQSTFRRHVTVITPQAKVEVKGTRFTVNVHREASKQWTDVDVERGEVLVTWLGGHQLLRAGQEWSSAKSSGSTTDEVGNTRDFAEQDTPVARADVPKRQLVHVVRRKPSAAHVQQAESTSDGRSAIADLPSSSASTLSQQNQLLERAIQAQRSGNFSEAGQLFDELLLKYPDSPLRSTALAEKRRIKRLED